MSTQDDLKAAHIAAADKRWEDAVRDAHRYLTYDRVERHPDFEATDETRAADAKVRKLTRLLFTVHDSTRHSALGGIEYNFGIEMDGYGPQVPHDLCGLMEFVRWFIGHEILDDGEPGIGYFRSTIGDETRTSDPFARCGKDHPKAQPYFHRNIDRLRADYPESKWLGVDGAIEVLEFYENRRAKMADSVRTHIEKFGDKAHWDAATLAHYSELTEEQQHWTSLADEIIAMEVE